MTIGTLRDELLQVRATAQSGDIAEIVRQLDDVLEHIRPDRLMTTTEAAHLLGVRSPNTILLWRRAGYIKGVKRGGRTLIPLSEIERIENSDQVREIQVLDAAHDEIANLGPADGMTDEQMEVLHASRPGTWPWERATAE